jgi:hypothetical protein
MKLAVSFHFSKFHKNYLQNRTRLIQYYIAYLEKFNRPKVDICEGLDRFSVF